LLATDDRPLDTAESMDESLEAASVVKLLTALLVARLLSTDVASLAREPTAEVPAARRDVRLMPPSVVVWALAPAAARRGRRRFCGFIFLGERFY